MSPVPQSRPSYKLGWEQRIAVGWKHRYLADLDRIGGAGPILTVIGVVGGIGLGAFMVSVLITGWDSPNFSGPERAAVLVVDLVALAVCWFLVRSGFTGIWVNDGRIRIRNFTRTVERPIGPDTTVERNTVGLYVIVTGDDSILVSGLAFWTDGFIRPSITKAARDELAWRLEREKARLGLRAGGQAATA